MRYQIFSALIICLLSLSSCGNGDGDWHTTAEGAKVHYKADSFFGGDYKWSGDTLEMGVAHGDGILSFEDNVNDDNNFKKKVNIAYGSMEVSDSEEIVRVGLLDDKGQLKGFGVKAFDNKVYIGPFKKDLLNGDGVIYRDGHVHYKGSVKDMQPHGKGMLYYADGSVRYDGKLKKGLYHGIGVLKDSIGNTVYEGKFSKGLYDGYGILYDSLGHSTAHVWDNGAIKPFTQKYYDQAQLLKGSAKDGLESRLLAWERYHVWMYIGWGLFIALLLLGCFGSAVEENKEERYNRSHKWNKWLVWLDWLFVGWLGVHRYVLKSYYGLVYPILVACLMIANMPELCFYLFWPSAYSVWALGVFSQTCLWIMAVCLAMDFFYIPWRCYELNHKWYRHDRNENLILRHYPTDIMQFGQTVKPKADTNSENVSAALKEIKEIHGREFSGKKGFLVKLGRAFSGNDPWLLFEQQRARELRAACKKAETAQNNYAEICETMNRMLAESRANAFRNFALAKELIHLTLASKGKKQELVEDVALDDNKLSISSSIEIVCNVEAGIDWEDTTSKAISNSTELLSMGIKGPWAIGIAIGASLLEGVFDAMNKAERAAEEANRQCAEAISQLSSVNNAIIKAHASVLRSAEMIIALNKANEAFWHAYAALRNNVFGKDPSLMQYIKGVRVPANLRESDKFRNDVLHLVQVCSEYNKINQSKM